MIDRAIQHVYRLRMAVVFEFLLILVGALQWMYARLIDAPLSTQTWGEMALLLPLEAWAIAMMGGSLLTFLGLLYPPSPRLIMIGCTVQIAHMSFLGVSAMKTGGDPVVGAFAFGLLVPLHLFLMAKARYDY